MGRTLVVVGLIVAAIGALMMLGLPLGRLPGDLVIERGRGRLYVPLVSCVLLSVLLSLVLSFFRK